MMKANVLIAEDEELERRALSVLLSKISCCDLTIIEAENGRQALELARKQAVDIALLDIRMPGLDGLKCARELQMLHPDIRVVFISAFDEFDYAQEAIRLGVDEYLLKPASLEAVQEMMLKLLDRIQRDRQRQEEQRRAKENSGKVLVLLEQELRNDLERGDVDAQCLESFLSIQGYRGCPCYVLVIKVLSVPSDNSVQHRAALRRVAERAEYFFKLNKWYLLSGCGSEYVYALAVDASTLSSEFVAEEADKKSEPVVKLLENMVMETLDTLGSRLLVGCTALDAAEGEGIFEAAQDAVIVAGTEHPVVFLKLERSDITGDCCGEAKVERAIEYLRAHLAEDVSLVDLAGIIGVSPFHLSRLFRLYKGDTFVHVFSRLRIDTAKALLRSGRFSVKEVCALVGFSDQGYFARVFKKYEGVSPVGYRER